MVCQNCRKEILNQGQWTRYCKPCQRAKMQQGQRLTSLKLVIRIRVKRFRNGQD